MKELWDLAIGPQVLPFTLLLLPVFLYWLLAALGTLDLDFLNVDLDADVDMDVDGDLDVDAAGVGDGAPDGGPGVFMSGLHGALRAVNATDVPMSTKTRPGTQPSQASSDELSARAAATNSAVTIKPTSIATPRSATV